MKIKGGQKMKRAGLVLSILGGVFLGLLSVVPLVQAQPTDQELLDLACGQSFLGKTDALMFESEFQEGAANALAERVMEGRRANNPLAIDTASTWEGAASGGTAACRALGSMLLVQIYGDAGRADNPYAIDTDGDGQNDAVDAAALAAAITGTFELARARAEALTIVCKAALFSGSPAEIIGRLENIAGGGSETIACGESEVTFDGSQDAVRAAIGKQLKGAYLAQLGPIALAPEIRDPAARAQKVCEELLSRATGGATAELQRAAAEAYVQGNAEANLPAAFTYQCVEQTPDALQAVTDGGGVLADAAVDLLAKVWAGSGADLASIAQTAASAQTSLAASLALGIETAGIGADIRAAVNNLRTALEASSTVALARGWAGEALDTAGVCIYAGGLNDCILVR